MPDAAGGAITQPLRPATRILAYPGDKPQPFASPDVPTRTGAPAVGPSARAGGLARQLHEVGPVGAPCVEATMITVLRDAGLSRLIDGDEVEALAGGFQ